MHKPGTAQSESRRPRSVYTMDADQLITIPMTEASRKIRFDARLLRPAGPARRRSWAFLRLPKAASVRLPTRSRTTVTGRFNERLFRTTLEPDGQKGHWLKVSCRLYEAAGAAVGDVVHLEIVPVDREPAPRVPADLRKALAAAPKAQAAWTGITPIARRDWIHWIASARRIDTRARRIERTCVMLAGGKRRVCCFDRSGFYSGGFSAPKAAK
jgi:hypothetical protein